MAKEEKDKRPNEINVGLISDTEELYEEDKENGVIEDIEDNIVEPKLPETSTQLRSSRRKRKYRDDDNF